MEELLDLLKYTVPALVVFVACFFILKKFMDNEYRKQLLELRKANQNYTTPLRLQAYERMILFLERVSLNNLVSRVQKRGMSAKQFQSDLIITVRTEFEHNLSQQIYVSQAAWDTVKLAKEEVIKVINVSATQVKDDATSAELSQKIFEILLKLEVSPTQMAISTIKKEVRQLF
ncbi:MAG: hypothetical protein KDD24_02200 [Flavobacteriales bacterium]|nr:hypothetical protein [Flavobacteriales bacterium]MCB9174251.1 hypothetical protein [Flavobacteriales bacterium]